MGRVGMKGHFQERVFVLEKQTGNIVFCLDGVGEEFYFSCFIFHFLISLTYSCKILCA